MEMIENSLASRMEGKIALKRKSVVLSLVLLVLGIAIIVVSAIIPALESGFMHSLLIFIGGVAAIIGLLLLLSAAFTKQYYYLPENSRLHKKIEYFDLTEESAIKRALENKEIANPLHLLCRWSFTKPAKALSSQRNCRNTCRTLTSL